MTELEKVINHQTNDIDFGKLIEEAKASLEGYANLIDGISEKELNDLPPTPRCCPH